MRCINILMNKLTAINWIKNDAQYLPEYIEFHLLQGVDHFIFYDDGSTDNTEEVLGPYYGDIAELRKYPPDVTERNNYWVMQHCISEQRGKSRWIFFHGVDERMFCPTGQPISRFLNSFKSYGGMCVAWKFFNSDGHKTRPEGLTIENFTESVCDSSCHIRTITQPRKTLTLLTPNPYASYPPNPHCFEYRHKKWWAVNENRRRVNGAFCPAEYHSMKRIVSHHYLTRSREEFDVKMNMGLLDIVGGKGVRRPNAQEQWDRMHDPSNVIGKDTSALRFVDQVRENLHQRYEKYDQISLLEKINH